MKRALQIWQGEHGEAEVAGLLFKTDAKLLEQAGARRVQRQWSPMP